MANKKLKKKLKKADRKVDRAAQRLADHNMKTNRLQRKLDKAQRRFRKIELQLRNDPVGVALHSAEAGETIAIATFGEQGHGTTSAGPDLPLSAEVENAGPSR
jgi:phage-related tail protein